MKDQSYFVLLDKLRYCLLAHNSKSKFHCSTVLEGRVKSLKLATFMKRDSTNFAIFLSVLLDSCAEAAYHTIQKVNSIVW